jgi:RNA polymerase sigma-70 factor (ECF subfamily)
MGEAGSPDLRFASLMAAAQAGDGEAYARLMRDLVPLLRRIIARRRRLSGSEDVEDLVQEVLLSVHVVRASYDPARPFLPWLLAITRNRLADGARRYARQSAHEVGVDDLDAIVASGDGKEQAGVYGDPDVLRQAIDNLPRGQRDAIQLLKIEERSLKEAAALSGTSVGALKVATHRAIGALRRRLTRG